MKLVRDFGPDDRLDPLHELGQVEAADPPPPVVVTKDAYVEDPGYDESLAALDPDEQGGELPMTTPEE